MEVQFVASVAPIVRDAEVARAFYGDALGLSFEGSDGEYVFTQKLDGTKHFGLWPLSEAATACFGTTEWPSEIPVPQASIEFEVADVAAAAKELEARGYGENHSGFPAGLELRPALPEVRPPVATSGGRSSAASDPSRNFSRPASGGR